SASRELVDLGCMFHHNRDSTKVLATSQPVVPCLTKRDGVARTNQSQCYGAKKGALAAPVVAQNYMPALTFLIEVDCPGQAGDGANIPDLYTAQMHGRHRSPPRGSLSSPPTPPRSTAA